jgi:hypothetical protein
MSLEITFDTPYGPVTLPFEQMIGLHSCLEAIRAEGKKPYWHPNECGCCISVHEDVQFPTGGYVIGQDGEYDWVEGNPHAN